MIDSCPAAHRQAAPSIHDDPISTQLLHDPHSASNRLGSCRQKNRTPTDPIHPSLSTQRTNMVSAQLKNAMHELMRQRQAGNITSLNDVALQTCMLLRLAALTSSQPRSDVMHVREELQAFIPETCVIEAVAGRVLEILEAPDLTRKIIEPELNALVTEVREAPSELTEQTASIFNPGDSVVVLGEAEGGAIEAALIEAAEGFVEENSGHEPLKVCIIRVAPDHENLAQRMHNRLAHVEGISASLRQDVCVTAVLRNCSKVLLSAIALDVEEGGLCVPGSSLAASAANRMKVPVVIVVPRHRMVPAGNSTVSFMSKDNGSPGKVWCYEESRQDSEHEAILVQGTLFDMVAMQKCTMIVTEYGGYALEYVKSLGPSFDDSYTDGS